MFKIDELYNLIFITLRIIIYYLFKTKMLLTKIKF